MEIYQVDYDIMRIEKKSFSWSLFIRNNVQYVLSEIQPTGTSRLKYSVHNGVLYTAEAALTSSHVPENSNQKS